MGYAARIVLDSISEAGDRLTTFEITFWRQMLSEFNTHRMLSRNSASSRAIPVKKRIMELLDDPFIPERFGINQPGMQSYHFLEGLKHDEAVRIWLRARDRNVTSTFEMLLGEKLSGEVFGYYPETSFATEERLRKGFEEAIKLSDPNIVYDEQLQTVDILDAHKQYANRLIETHMWQTVVVTATDWSNFYALRVSPAAQPEIFKIAKMMKELHDASTPQLVKMGEWHLPFIQDDEQEWAKANWRQGAEVSSARSGRVSYLTHNGIRDVSEDLKMYQRLVIPGHMSPLEHPATPAGFEREMDSIGQEYVTEREAAKPRPYFGNLRGWKPLRKFIYGENDYSLMGKE